ncbi:hypothetical protein [Kribbella deserti]|uniref:Uncharacterized protein n=1 Tax=Kribbella deserti TaxID=1926257 RepID=A0ABV6QIR1_9ACTN
MTLVMFSQVERLSASTSRVSAIAASPGVLRHQLRLRTLAGRGTAA